MPHLAKSGRGADAQLPKPLPTVCVHVWGQYTSADNDVRYIPIHRVCCGLLHARIHLSVHCGLYFTQEYTADCTSLKCTLRAAHLQSFLSAPPFDEYDWLIMGKMKKGKGAPPPEEMVPHISLDASDPSSSPSSDVAFADGFSLPRHPRPQLLRLVQMLAQKRMLWLFARPLFVLVGHGMVPTALFHE